MKVMDLKTEREKPKRKRKKKAEDNGSNCASSQAAITNPLKVKKLKVSSGSESSTFAGAEVTKKRRQREKQREVTKPFHYEEEVVDVEEEEEEEEEQEDEEETCAAKSCYHPSGDEVGWVQCDLCQQWYHLLCVSLSPEQAEEMDAYSCPSCTHDSSRTTTNACSPESENIDVDSTTPNATTPTSPTSPVSLLESKEQRNVNNEAICGTSPGASVVITILDD